MIERIKLAVNIHINSSFDFLVYRGYNTHKIVVDKGFPPHPSQFFESFSVRGGRGFFRLRSKIAIYRFNPAVAKLKITVSNTTNSTILHLLSSEVEGASHPHI